MKSSRLAKYFKGAVAGSRLKLKLQGSNGNMSVNLAFILIAAAQRGGS